ncbi:hypothetical protein VP424E501_P0152 [Vibrio phage 424E50-1]|nr:hypothetical protein VP424E501_P0152 [Vibrio phage 424E50-1]
MLWYLELNGEQTNINFPHVTTEMEILGDLENELDTKYPEDFPYGCYDVEILSRTENVIEINIIHESEDSDQMEKTDAIIRKR